MDNYLSHIQSEKNYPVHASSGFADRVILALATRAERAFLKKMIMLWAGLLGSLSLMFYVLATILTKVLALDLFEFVDLGMQSPEVLTTSEWQSTVLEAIPLVELAAAFGIVCAMILLLLQLQRTLSRHTLSYAHA